MLLSPNLCMSLQIDAVFEDFPLNFPTYLMLLILIASSKQFVNCYSFDEVVGNVDYVVE